jgi:putative nucleotidyltransferase with HDIG domain
LAVFFTGLDFYLSSKDQKHISSLIRKTFGFNAVFLSNSEADDVAGERVVSCPAPDCACSACPVNICFEKPVLLGDAPVSVSCVKGEVFHFLSLKVEEKSVGTLQLGPCEKVSFSQSSATNLMIQDWIDSKILVKLEKDQLNKKKKLLLFLVDSTKMINSLGSADELLTYLTDISTYVTNATTGFILKLYPDTNELGVYTARGVLPGFDKDVRFPVGNSASGWVAKHGEPLIISDTSKDDRYAESGYRAGSELAVPIKCDGQVIGVLVVDAFAKNAFSVFDQKLLCGLAQQVSTVMGATSHELASKSRNEELAIVNEVARVSGDSLHPSEMMEKVMVSIGKIFSAAGVAVLLRQDGNDELIVLVDGQEIKHISDYDIYHDDSILGRVIRENKALLLNLENEELHEDLKNFVSDENSSIVSVPLRDRGKVFGAILVTGGEAGKSYGEHELNLLTTLASQVAQSVRNGQLFERTERQVAELSLITEVGKALNSSLDLDNLLQYIVDMISSIIEASRSSLMLLDASVGELSITVAKGMTAQETNNVRFGLGEGVAGVVAETRTPILIRDTRTDPRFIDLSGKNKALTMICAPVVNKDQVIGVLNFERPLCDKYPFGEDDLNLLSTLAAQAGIAIENARLYQNLITVYFDTIRSLANALEAKDAYTHGHSRRVAKDSVRIAKALGHDRKFVETIRHAALLHDIGKIGIRDAILFKPGKLTEEEMEHIREHPVVGANMIQSIEFLKDVTDIIRYHHERVDGKGFPYGLSGMDIPIGARIVCIADAFDAMTTTRPYREGMIIPRALEELVAHKGTQFDPELVDVFVGIIYSLHPSLMSHATISPALA